MHNQFHPKVNIEDALLNGSDIFWEHRARHSKTTIEAEKKKFREALERGEKVMPYFEGTCSNFDDQFGCRGHLAGDK